VAVLQSELATRSQKKVIELTVSYYQSAALTAAMTLILSTIPSFSVQKPDGTFLTFEGKKIPPDPFPS
jgi:hypothetical protein